MDIIKTLAKELSLKETQVENTVKLLDEGNTIPFIARYRKEMTGSLDDQLVRQLSERLEYLRGLEEKREQIRKLIAEQDKLTDEINLALDNAQTVTELDDIYRPYRPKRRTRATIAKEKGLEGLATFIWMQSAKEDISAEAEKYIDPEKEVNTAVPGRDRGALSSGRSTSRGRQTSVHCSGLWAVPGGTAGVSGGGSGGDTGSGQWRIRL